MLPDQGSRDAVRLPARCGAQRGPLAAPAGYRKEVDDCQQLHPAQQMKSPDSPGRLFTMAWSLSRGWGVGPFSPPSASRLVKGRTSWLRPHPWHRRGAWQVLPEETEMGTEDKASNKVQDVKGKVKEAAGKVTA